MENINKRLDALRELLKNDDFLAGRGLSNEVNIRIFCYDPKDEMTVRDFSQRIITDRSMPCHLIECNLYQFYLSICDDLEISDEIAGLEESDGSAYLLKQLENAINEKNIISKMKYSPHNMGDVLLLTGVGDVYPFIRVHSLLEAIQSDFSDIPIVVLYPGTFKNEELQLFNKLEPNGYYRAFNVI